jgi:hypothetical protein
MLGKYAVRKEDWLLTINIEDVVFLFIMFEERQR